MPPSPQGAPGDDRVIGAWAFGAAHLIILLSCPAGRIEGQDGAHAPQALRHDGARLSICICRHPSREVSSLSQTGCGGSLLLQANCEGDRTGGSPDSLQILCVACREEAELCLPEQRAAPEATLPKLAETVPMAAPTMMSTGIAARMTSVMSQPFQNAAYSKGTQLHSGSELQGYLPPDNRACPIEFLRRQTATSHLQRSRLALAYAHADAEGHNLVQEVSCL